MKKINIIQKSELGQRKIIEHYDNMKRVEKINLFLMGIKITKIEKGLQISFPDKYDKIFDNISLETNKKLNEGLKELIIDFEKEGIQQGIDFDIEMIK